MIHGLNSAFGDRASPPVSDRSILLIGRPGGIADTLAPSLQAYGYQVRHHDLADARALTLSNDMVETLIIESEASGANMLPFIRDVAALPGRPGLIILDTGREVADRVLALEMGADDYVEWPCALRELIARIRAIARRRDIGEMPYTAVEDDGPDALSFSGWTLDRPQRLLTNANGGSESLSAAEFAVLDVLASRPRRVISREALLQETAHGGEPDSRNLRAIDIQVSRLRKRLEIDGEEIIRTVRGRGYMLMPAVTPG